MFAIRTGVTAVVATVLVGVSGCGSTPDPGPTGSSTISSVPSASATPSATPVTANVPIYYLGTVGSARGEPKLFREYHRLAAGDGSVAAKIKAAVTAMLDGRTAYDADYFSQWPASASVGGVTIDGGVATLDLARATVNAREPTGNAAAVQQLIWTATAFSGGTGVRLLFDGAPRTTWGGVPVDGTLRRAPAATTLAPVRIIDPQAKAVTGTSVTVNLAGIVFEATIQVRVRDSGGTVIARKTVRLTAGAPAEGTGVARFTLATGSYTVEAYEVSLKDGHIVALDGHPFTVR